MCFFCLKEAHSNNDKSKVLCTGCNRYCFNNQCLIDHSISVCLAVYKCIRCNKIVKREEEDRHQCGYEQCRNCKEIVHINTHKCYMLRKNAKGGRCSEGCTKCSVNKTCIINSDVDIPVIVKKNYRKLILETHPDKGGDKYKFARI